MKTLIIATALLLPLGAQARMNLSCKANGLVDYNIIGPRGGLPGVGSTVTIVANGILHLVLDSRVDAVDLAQPGKVIFELTTLNEKGEEDSASGKATLTIDRAEGEETIPAGTAHIHLSKFPPQKPDNIIFNPDYNLSRCTGTIQ